MIGSIGTSNYAAWTSESMATMQYIVVFEVSDDKIHTFEGFTRDSNIRQAKHDIHLQKPKSEFLGPELDNIAFVIKLKAQFGVNPRDEMDKLLILQRVGIPVVLTIGNKNIGMNKWTIVSLGQAWETVDNEGRLLEAQLSVTLEEYL